MAARPSALTEKVTADLRALLAAEPDAGRLAQALRHLAKWRAALIEATLRERSGERVLAGPFAGMDYGGASEGAGAARLLGVYEPALHPVIEAIIARAPDLILDLGAAEGYYAVGLALRLPGARVLAFDSDRVARARCRAMAERNGVADRVAVMGTATRADFDRCAGHRALVLCDIEGAEETLLDPAEAPALASADILVEAHDCFVPGLSQRLADRFASTHRVTRLDRGAPDAPLPAWMNALSDLDRLLAVWEWRMGPTPWLWMEARR